MQATSSPIATSLVRFGYFPPKLFSFYNFPSGLWGPPRAACTAKTKWNSQKEGRFGVVHLRDVLLFELETHNGSQADIWECSATQYQSPFKYLPSLNEKRSVYGSQPHDAVPRLEVSKLVALLIQKVSQTFQQLGRARLNHGFPVTTWMSFFRWKALRNDVRLQIKLAIKF